MHRGDAFGKLIFVLNVLYDTPIYSTYFSKNNAHPSSIVIKSYICAMEKNPTHEKVKAYVEKYYKSFYNENLRVEEAMSVFYVYNHPEGSPMVFTKSILKKI